nr:hypothetical protein E2R29_18275 [Burkholderia pseudomallei]
MPAPCRRRYRCRSLRSGRRLGSRLGAGVRCGMRIASRRAAKASMTVARANRSRLPRAAARAAVFVARRVAVRTRGVWRCIAGARFSRPDWIGPIRWRARRCCRCAAAPGSVAAQLLLNCSVVACVPPGGRRSPLFKPRLRTPPGAMPRTRRPQPCSTD